jgi:hypothetical protein
MEKLGPENLGKDWAEGRTKKMEDLDRLERLEQTKKEGRSASPMRPESELHSLNFIFLPVATLRMRGPRLVRDSTDTGNITIDYLYYNHTIVLSYTIVRLLQYYDSIHYT